MKTFKAGIAAFLGLAFLLQAEASALKPKLISDECIASLVSTDIESVHVQTESGLTTLTTTTTLTGREAIITYIDSVLEKSETLRPSPTKGFLRYLARLKSKFARLVVDLALNAWSLVRTKAFVGKILTDTEGTVEDLRDDARRILTDHYSDHDAAGTYTTKQMSSDVLKAKMFQKNLEILEATCTTTSAKLCSTVSKLAQQFFKTKNTNLRLTTHLQFTAHKATEETPYEVSLVVTNQIRGRAKVDTGRPFKMTLHP